MAFGSIHNHSDASNTRGFLDSTNKIEDLINYAKELGHIGLVLTDHDTITNHYRALSYMKSVKKEKSEEWKNFKIGLGNEIYLCSRKEVQEEKKYKFYHFILVAKDLIGHEQIRTLSTRAWADESFTWVNIRTPTYYDSLFEVVETDRGHLIASTACFIKDTPVLTNKGWKPIQKINSEDFIKNMYGEWEKVNFPTTRQYNGLGYKISLYGNIKPIICTKTHEFLTTTSFLNSKYASKEKRKNSLIWKTGEEIQINNDSDTDLLLMPITHNYTNNNIIKKKEWQDIILSCSKYSKRRYILPNEIEITPELMRFFGLWLGDGSITIAKNIGIGLSFNKEEFPYYFKFVKKATKPLGIKWYIKKERQNKIDIFCASRDFVNFMYYLFGLSHAKDKYIPQRLKNISKELDIELVFGYLLASGYFRIRKNGSGIAKGYVSGKFVSASISEQLTQDFYELINSLKISCGISLEKAHVDKNNVNHKNTYYLIGSNKILGAIKKKQNYSHEQIVDIFIKATQDRKKDFLTIQGIDYRKIRIKKIEEIQLNEQVYCLNVDSHSFVCNGVIVHNCLGGKAPELILDAYQKNPENPDYRLPKKWLKRMLQCFGEGNFFLELQPSRQEDQKIVNKAYIQLSEELNIPYIFTCDTHYLKKEDRMVHEAFLKSNEDSGKEREMGEFYATTYLMNEQEIHEYTDDYLGYEAVQKGLDNTKLIFDQLEDYSLDQELIIPYIPLEDTEPDKKLINKYCKYMPILKKFSESEYQSNRHLVKLILEKIDENQEELVNKETFEAIEDNLKTINLISDKTGQQWSGYLIQVRDLVNTCWEAGSLVAPGRGSGVGFILLYLLDITQINPLKEETKTYPWRFLNPERVSVPDIDSDFINYYRDDVIKLLQKKYCGEDEKAGKRRVMKVQTLSTVKAKSAIQTAARGLGVTPEEAQYLSSFIIAPRGMQYNLTQTFYGDENENLPPNKEFVELMTNRYKDVWEVARNIEGLINGVGSHAGGVVITSEPIEKYCALMKTSSGDIITQHDLHQIENEGLIKDDLLATDCLGKIKTCLELLLKDNLIEWQGSLKATYEKYIGVYKIERNNPEIWDMICKHKIISLFQMEKQSGIQAIKIGKPTSLTDLSGLNSIMRLMAVDGGESPLERYGRFKENIQLWYDEMTEYGLNKHEQDIIRKYAEKSFGLLPNQEDFMMVVQDPEIGGLSLLWADKLRKSVAKKNPKEFITLQQEFYDNIEAKGLSSKLCHYVWDVLITMNKG